MEVCPNCWSSIPRSTYTPRKKKEVKEYSKNLMKIRPVILCGGAGTRLSPLSNNLPKQFIDFGGWNLFEKTLERIKNPVFDNPIISTNKKYLNLVKRSLKKKKFKKFILVLEPLKKNTAAAILISSLVEEVSHDQNLVFFSSDHLIEKNTILTKSLLSNYSKLNSDNMCILVLSHVLSQVIMDIFNKKKCKSSCG